MLETQIARCFSCIRPTATIEEGHICRGSVRPRGVLRWDWHAMRWTNPGGGPARAGNTDAVCANPIQRRVDDAL